ncbi:hypothetical protein KSP39_PZI010230 [Platanthera zijinensis]|uniref:Suppressor of white apricot N-terminal domain-containing protein n=1 Tax=Platanthera zijinensis TaxID=2320716 RepID=A0AAP0G670_9ASPA
MWHEARRSERKVHDLMDAARRRAQRRAVFLAKRRGDPQQSLQVVGSRCRVHRDEGLYKATQDQQGLMQVGRSGGIPPGKRPRQVDSPQEAEMNEGLQSAGGSRKDLLGPRSAWNTLGRKESGRRRPAKKLIGDPAEATGSGTKVAPDWKEEERRRLVETAGGRCRRGHWNLEEVLAIPWNGKQDILIDRFDGRALLDFIRDPSSRPFRVDEKSEEEEEVEEFVNFERYRDLIKHRRRGCRIHFCRKYLHHLTTYGFFYDTDDDALRHVCEELEAKSTPSFTLERPHASQSTAGKGSYSQVGFSYKGDGNEESNAMDSDEEDEDEEDDDDKDISSDDSNDEGMELIAKDFGIKRYNWLVYMDQKAKEEEKRQKEVIRGDPSIRKLSRKERRKASQMEREKEREASRILGRAPYNDPYRETRRSPTYEAYPHSRRSRSRSRSPSYSRRHDRGAHSDNGHRSKAKPPKIEYITEFGGSADTNDRKLGAISPPSSPLQDDIQNRLPGSRILEALHVDPASALSVENDKNTKVFRNTSSSGVAKLNKAATPAGSMKPEQVEKKETPQERLKRIMNKQLTKQIKKDSAVEMAKKREQERQRLEKLAETSRLSRYRRRSRSRSRSRSLSPESVKSSLMSLQKAQAQQKPRAEPKQESKEALFSLELAISIPAPPFQASSLFVAVVCFFVETKRLIETLSVLVGREADG